jgi:CubicO group peptidase (beta-lactamase class C family)
MRVPAGEQPTRGKDEMAEGGFSKSGLARMHDVLAGQITRGELPGLVVVVSRHGQTHVDAIGTMRVGGTEPIRRDTIFRISSMSKPIAAAATMILVDEGRLRLDEPVDRLLPELANRRVLKRIDGPLDDTVPAKRPVTVRDLLTFTMGFGLLFADPDAVPILKAANDLQIGMGPPAPSSMPAPDEWIRRLGTLPLMHQPGEQWRYNTGADVLSVLLTRASGKPLEAFLRERLFDPLGMKDTAFHVPAAKMDRFGPTYWTNFMTGQDAIYDEAEGGQWSRPPAFPSGAGGLVSTADDYRAFALMLMDRGRHRSARILSEESVAAMTRDQLTPDQKRDELVEGYWKNHGWGFGMSVVTRPDELTSVAGRYGWNGGMGTSWFNDPNEDLVAILMTSRMWTSPDPPDVCRDFWKLAYESVRA